MNTLDAWFLELLAISWRAGLLILGLIGVRWVVRRHLPAGMVFALWLLLAGVLLVPWRARLPAGWGQRMMTRVFPPKAAAMTTERPKRSMQGYPIYREGVDNPALTVARAVKHDEVQLGDHVTMERSWFEYALLTWLFGLAVLVVFRAAAAMSFWRRLRRNAQTAGLRVERVLERCGAKMGLRRLPQVKTTRLVGGPALSGFWRPWLLMPPGLSDKLSGPELEWVIRHELAHLQRRDLWAQALLQAACIVHWFNPLVWWAARLARHDCELACDASVLRQAAAEQREDYGCVLLKVMSVTSGRLRVPAALGISENKRQLKRRIGMIADHRATGKGRVLAGGLLLGTFAVVGYTQEVSANKPEPAASAPQVPPAIKPIGFHAMVRPKLSPEVEAQIKARAKERAAWESKLQFELRAVGSIGGVAVAIIDMNGQPQAVTARSQLYGWVVDRIDAQKKTVVLTKPGQPARELPLTHPSEVKFRTLADRDKDIFIKTSIQRFRHYPIMPREVESAWRQMDHDSREAILVNYLNSGIVINQFIEPTGTGGGNTSLLFGAQISELRQQDQDRFLNSLTPDQREKYHSGMMGVINFTASPAEQKEQYERAKAMANDEAEVVNGLTVEQRKLYDVLQEWSTNTAPMSRL